jgi:hypothetical protein
MDADGLEPASLPPGPRIPHTGEERGAVRALVGAVVALVVALTFGAVAFQSHRSEKEVPASAPVSPAASSATGDPLPSRVQLLDSDQIRRLGDTQEWRVERTGDNTSGTGINSVCQAARFADPGGTSATVRTFRALGQPTRTAVQTVEVSRTAEKAARAFRTTVDWYAGCRVGRLQLLNAYRVDNIGDEADVLMIRLWGQPVTTMSVAVARTGTVTTSTVGRTVGGAPPSAGQITQSLADAVAMLCAGNGAGGGARDCAKRPTYRVVPPPPSGEEPGLLAVADLPPVGRINRPWVGTDPTGGSANPAATTCDRASFVREGATRTRSRTYLIPGAAVPTRFGLSETYGVFGSPQGAARFLSTMRGRIAGCEGRNLATTASGDETLRRSTPQLDLSTWILTTKVSSSENVRFRVGFVRAGRAVAQVTFAPAPADDMSDSGFRSLLVRSGDRLRELG